MFVEIKQILINKSGYQWEWLVLSFWKRLKGRGGVGGVYQIENTSCIFSFFFQRKNTKSTLNLTCILVSYSPSNIAILKRGHIDYINSLNISGLEEKMQIWQKLHFKLFLAALSSSRSIVVCWLVGPLVGPPLWKCDL